MILQAPEECGGIIRDYSEERAEQFIRDEDGRLLREKVRVRERGGSTTNS